ncbi:unnamed protein product [Schistocephalus solidus]|uniref:Transposase n=1 Tax=Schistocephalus solidus TaxID=70667 RepID=A0A183TQL6_SCHSO|nr:unnamed protein product [Schistocephalus solidus]
MSGQNPWEVAIDDIRYNGSSGMGCHLTWQRLTRPCGMLRERRAAATSTIISSVMAGEMIRHANHILATGIKDD